MAASPVDIPVPSLMLPGCGGPGACCRFSPRLSISIPKRLSYLIEGRNTMRRLTSRSTLDRRQWLASLGVAASASGLLSARKALANHSPSPTEGGLWFEWTDGSYYRHEYVLASEGLWLNEHDGYFHLYEDYEITDNGIWLTREDGDHEYFECLTDDVAEDSLTGYHWMLV